MGFNYKTTHKASRDRLFVDPPSYADLIKVISTKKLKTSFKAYLGMLLMTGARTSEVLNSVQGDYKFYNNTNGSELNLTETLNLKTVVDRFDFGKFIVTMKILKQKKKLNKAVRYKRISCIRSEVFMEPFDWVVDHFKTQPVDPTRKLFDFTRGQAWWWIKAHLGDGYWNHFFRHVVASNDVSAGMNVALVQNKLGHKSLESMNTYLHMRSQDTEDAMRKAYGGTLQKYPVNINGPITPTQYMGALAATNQIGEKVSPPYKKKEAIIRVNNKLIAVPMNQNARVIRDNLRAAHPELAKMAEEEKKSFWVEKNSRTPTLIVKKTQKEIDNELLQVV